MNHLALARTWRPKTFAELVGQEHVVKALRNALDSGRVHHAFLFTGTRGVGKTTIARIFAKSLNCETGIGSDPCGVCAVCRDVDAGRFVDLIEIDAASRTKVDDTRELLEDVVYAPSRGRYKVFLIDEVHMLSGHSFNALLKTLEEPPEHVKFLLATTDPQKLPVTVLSRCLQFNLRRLRAEEIAGQMQRILATETIPADAGALALLAHAADGSLRDGLSLLDQAIAHGGGRVDAADVRAMLGTIDQDAVLRLLEALADGDGPALYAVVESLAAFVVDYGSVLDAVATALHHVQLTQVLPALATDIETRDKERLRALGGRMAAEDVQLYYQIATQGTRDFELAPTPRIGLEMCLLRMLAFRPESADGASVGSDPAAAGKALPSASPSSRATHGAPVQTTDRQPAQPRIDEPAAQALPMPGDTRAWVAILDRMGIRAGARQLADNCIVLDQQDGQLRLGLGREHELLLSEMSRRQIEQGLVALVGSPTRLRIEIIADDPAAAPSVARVETPAVLAEQARLHRQSTAESDFAGDANVQAALARFDAEIVPASIRPL